MEASEFFGLIARDEDAALAVLEREPKLASARTEQGISVVCMAVYRQRKRLAGALAAARTDLDLFEAACVGDRARVQQLLMADPGALGAVSPDGFGALGYSAFFGHVELLGDLIARGADVHVASRNPMQVQPLHSAAAQSDPGKATELARKLLAAGANPNAKQQGGYTPLQEAAQNGNLALLDLLLEHGADPTLASDGGHTALDLARKAGHAGAVSKLEAAAARARV